MSSLPTPRTPAPDLSFDTIDGDEWRMADQQPDRFTMVVFYRGLHCPVCRGYLGELEDLLDDFASRGVDVVAVSGDNEERARRAQSEWGLEQLTLGYGLEVDAMREWGLFVSSGIADDEPAEFGEPGLFLIEPDGRVFYGAVNSSPWGRPQLEEVRGGVDFVVENDYPARGAA